MNIYATILAVYFSVLMTLGIKSVGEKINITETYYDYSVPVGFFFLTVIPALLGYLAGKG